MLDADFLLTHAGQLTSLAHHSNDAGPRRGSALAELAIVNDGAVAAQDGTIVWVGRTDDIGARIRLARDGVALDATGQVVTPGLIDPHTHPVYARSRAHEFELRALGKSYQDISAAGGGIKNSVAAVREADLESLVNAALASADRMLDCGTTTAEAKSGYGLSTEAELKLLCAIKRVNQEHVIDWVPTVLAAHEFPPEYGDRHDEYVQLVCDEILPMVAEQQLAEFSDVFFETGVFDARQTEQIQRTAASFGFGLKFHVDELSDVGGAALAAKMNAVSADHLEFISPDGVAALARSNTMAVLLPGTAYFLDLKRRPPVREMINDGVAVAVATDCNPGSNMTESMPLAMNQACVLYKMTPAEALSAATINAAWAIRRADRIGTIEVGKACDLVVWDTHDYREIAYHYGINLAQHVVKAGQIVRGEAA